MALIDTNGKITIDEIAAKSDIRNLEKALAQLRESERTISSIIREAASTQGETGIAINDKSNELLKNIRDMIKRIEDTISFITRTVNHYIVLDQKAREIINSANLLDS